MKIIAFLCIAAISLGWTQPTFPASYTAEDIPLSIPLGQMSGQPTFQSNAVHEPISDSIYLVGPGDEFRIIMLGAVQENEMSAVVDPEGNILLPKIGVIRANKVLRDVKKDIADLIKQKTKYREIIVDLSKVRSSIISVLGNVDKPGSFIFNSTVRLNDVLIKVFTRDINSQNYPISNLRHVLIRSPDGTQKGFDFQNYLLNGDNQDNPFLFSGDRVIVLPRRNIVNISGSVSRIGVFDHQAFETLSDLIRFCGGLRPDADSTNITVISYSPDGTDLKTQKFDFPVECDAYLLQPGDNIIVGGIPYWHEQTNVDVLGRVKNPGRYVVEKGTPISKVLEMAGGLLKDADLNIAYLRRELFTNLSLESDKGYRTEISDVYLMTAKKLNLDFNNVLLKDKGEFSYPAADGDIIYIPWKTTNVAVVGIVANPGLFDLKTGEDASYYIDKAGGCAYNAFKSRTRVYKAAKGVWISAEDVETITAGDIIYIPEKPLNYDWDRLKDIISITTGILTTGLLLYSTLAN